MYHELTLRELARDEMLRERFVYCIFCRALMLYSALGVFYCPYQWLGMHEHARRALCVACLAKLSNSVKRKGAAVLPREKASGRKDGGAEDVKRLARQDDRSLRLLPAAREESRLVASLAGLRWLQEECGHECAVQPVHHVDGSWSLELSCGCEACEHHVRKVASLLYPDIKTVVVQ